MHTRARKSAWSSTQNRRRRRQPKRLIAGRRVYHVPTLSITPYCILSIVNTHHTCQAINAERQNCIQSVIFFPTQRARCLIGRKGGRTQCALVKLLIYIPEWHKREGKALFHSHLSAGRRCAVRRDRMRPNNSELSEGFFLAP